MTRTWQSQLAYELARAVQLTVEEEWKGVEYHLERALGQIGEKILEVPAEEHWRQQRARSLEIASRNATGVV